MKVLNHILIAVAYTMVAMIVAILVPRWLPAIDANAGALIGGVLLFGSALLHEVFSRQESQAQFIDDVAVLRAENANLRTTLDEARSEVVSMRGAMDSFTEERSEESENGRREVDSVIAEVKVLQGLIEQFATASAATAKPVRDKVIETPAPKPVAPPERSDDVLVPTTLDTKPAAPVDELPPVATGLDDDTILAIVREGLERNRVDLVLQPIVRLPQRKRAYFEAFTRIRDQNGSMLVPNQYIGIAEREGLIVAIDNMMLFRCVQLVRRTQSRNYNIGVFCNISAHSLTDRHFFSNFIEFMADNTALAADLIFEFPYATIANCDEEIEQHLRHLASLGFRFSVDQVSSLHIDYDDLVRHRFKFVKIDANILLQEVRQPTGNIAVEDIKRIFDRHGMDMIVEKIESESELLELLDLRVDFGQGYLFGAPRLSRIE